MIQVQSAQRKHLKRLAEQGLGVKERGGVGIEDISPKRIARMGEARAHALQRPGEHETIRVRRKARPEIDAEGPGRESRGTEEHEKKSRPLGHEGDDCCSFRCDHGADITHRIRSKGMPEASPSTKPLRILFVCSGNICRSPLAEAIFKAIAQEAGLSSRFTVDSAGTHGFHEGEPADPRTRRVGRAHGLEVDSIARPVKDSDFDAFDLIIAMDRGHRRELMARAGRDRRASVRLMREFDAQATGQDVLDPYYGGLEGFETMHSVLEPACRGLLSSLRD